jgi:hypothetical protein
LHINPDLVTDIKRKRLGFVLEVTRMDQTWVAKINGKQEKGGEKAQIEMAGRCTG